MRLMVTFINFCFQYFAVNFGWKSPDTIITFPEPVKTQLVRIKPISWPEYLYFRFEVLGCPGESTIIT